VVAADVLHEGTGLLGAVAAPRDVAQLPNDTNVVCIGHVLLKCTCMFEPLVAAGMWTGTPSNTHFVDIDQVLLQDTCQLEPLFAAMASACMPNHSNVVDIGQM
jgi:hypothetical protein